MFSVCRALLLTWVLSTDSTQQEAPGVCWTSRRQRQLANEAQGSGASAPGFVCWLECCPQRSLTTEDNSHRPWKWRGVRDLGSMLLKSTWHSHGPHGSPHAPLPGLLPNLQSGWSRSWEALQNPLHPGGHGCAFVRRGDGSLWRSQGFIIPPSTWLAPFYALTMLPCASVVLTSPPHGQTCSLQIDGVDFCCP